MFSNIREISYPVIVSIGYFDKVDKNDDDVDNPFRDKGKKFVEKKFIADMDEISYKKIWPNSLTAKASPSSLKIGAVAKDFGMPDTILMKIEDFEGRSVILTDDRYVKEPSVPAEKEESQ
jgi:hypothetical protein